MKAPRNYPTSKSVLAEIQYGYGSFESIQAQKEEDECLQKYIYYFMPSSENDPMQCFPPAFEMRLPAYPLEVKEALEKEGIYNPFQEMQNHGSNRFSYAIYADENDANNEKAIAFIKSLF